MKQALVFIFLICHSYLIFGQGETDNSGNLITVNLSAAFHVPGRDLANRFDNNAALGGGLDFMTEKSNLIFGAQGSFIFGSDVKEDVLNHLRTPEGNLVANNRTQANIALRERGFYLGGHFGKLFSLSSANPRSGIRFTLGAGFLQHKIRIQDDPSAPAASIADAYKKGYDRLTNGFALHEFIGYQYLAPNRRINFYAGLELIQAFTQSRRSFNYDTRVADTQKRLDLLTGFKIGWSLPFYLGYTGDEILY